MRHVAVLVLLLAGCVVSGCSDSKPTSSSRCETLPTNGERFEALVGERKEAFQELADELGYTMAILREDDTAFVINLGATVNRAYVFVRDGVIAGVAGVQSPDVRGRIGAPCSDG